MRPQRKVSAGIYTESVEVEEIHGVDVVVLFPAKSDHEPFVGNVRIVAKIEQDAGVGTKVIRRRFLARNGLV